MEISDFHWSGGAAVPAKLSKDYFGKPLSELMSYLFFHPPKSAIGKIWVAQLAQQVFPL